MTLDRNWYVIRSGKRDNIIDLFTWTAKPARWSVFMHQDLTRDLQRLYHAQITIIYRRVPARLLIQTLRGINWLLREGEPLREKSLCVLKIYFDPTINCTRKNWYLVRFLTHFRVRTFDKIKEGAEANFNTFVRYRAERYKYRAHVLLAVVQCVTISAADADHALIVINGWRYCVPRPLPFVVSAAYA